MIQALVYGMLAIAFLYETFLAFLTYRNRNQPLSPLVQDIYEPERYKKWYSYLMDTLKFQMIQRTLRYGWMLLLLLLGVFPLLFNRLSGLGVHLDFQNLLFLAGYYLLVSWLDWGLDYYRQFAIEKRYGFHKATNKTFFLDKVKATLLIFVLGGLLSWGIMRLLAATNNPWVLILVVWGVGMVLQVIINLLYTTVFVRIFNKLTPLQEGSLKTKIEAVAARTNVQIKSISIMDASRRSGKLNAFFSGFGKHKHVVLFDTLVATMTEDEIVSVLAHEIGHGKYKHVFKNMIISAVMMLFYLSFFLFLVSNPDFSTAFGFEATTFGFGIVLFSILISPFDSLLQIPLSMLSRKHEYQADGYAVLMGYGEAMQSALKQLAKANLSNLTPHPIVVALTYSHPPIHNRVVSIQSKLTSSQQ